MYARKNTAIRIQRRNAKLISHTQLASKRHDIVSDVAQHKRRKKLGFIFFTISNNPLIKKTISLINRTQPWTTFAVHKKLNFSSIYHTQISQAAATGATDEFSARHLCILSYWLRIRV